MKRKVIGSYPICNNVGLAVYEIDESNDRVLVGFNNNPPAGTRSAKLAIWVLVSVKLVSTTAAHLFRSPM